MKLRRIISALIVFTLVMASAVCSVNAAGTYQTTTSYDISTGNITVNVDIANATADSMISYMIIAPVTGEDGTTSYDVQADGSNIKHIDQATVNANGVATMDKVIAPFSGDDGFKGAKVRFVSTVDGDLTAYTAGDVSKHTYTKSVEQFDDYVTGVTMISTGATNSAGIYITYVKGAEVVTQKISGNMTNEDRWGKTDGILNERPATSGDHTAIVVPSDAEAIIIDAKGKSDRDMTKTYNITMKSVAGSFTGEQNEESAYETLYEKCVDSNLMINGRYKDRVDDQILGEAVSYTPGSMIALHGSTSKLASANKLYMTVDATPLISTYTDVDGNEYSSITFLATAKTANVDASNVGLKIYAYPKNTLATNADIAEEGDVIEVGTFRNIAVEDAYSDKFGIELVDTAGDWDFTAYDFEAVPVYYEDGSETAIELSVLGGATESLSKYYSIDRTTTAEVVEE